MKSYAINYIHQFYYSELWKVFGTTPFTIHKALYAMQSINKIKSKSSASTILKKLKRAGWLTYSKEKELYYLETPNDIFLGMIYWDEAQIRTWAIRMCKAHAIKRMKGYE